MEKKTKSITITQFDYIISHVNDEEIDIHGHPNHYSEFDPEGRPLKEIRYNGHGEFEEMFEYGYDGEGRLIRESYYQVEGELAEEKSFVRNEAGVIQHALKHYQDGSLDTISYEYNGAGELIKRTTTTDEGEIEQVETFGWENGEMVSHEITDADGEVVDGPDQPVFKPNESRITHNEQGQVVTEEELDENGEVFMTVNRTYLDDGHSDEVDVFIDGQGKAISRHYLLKYEYTFFE
ncbi:MAG: hypothetical protein ACOYNC_07720 [Bacteroidales bacterium]